MPPSPEMGPPFPPDPPIADPLGLADHTVEVCLREVPGQRRVYRTLFLGQRCVTRVLLAERLPPSHEALVRRFTLTGLGSIVGVPEAVALTLEGYRVATLLGEALRSPPAVAPWPAGPIPPPADNPRWPRVLAAGLTPTHHVYVTTTYIEGTPLHELPSPLLHARRRRLSVEVAALLRALHGARVAYGDLKKENLVLRPDGGLSLIDLDTMREVPDDRIAVVTRDLTRGWAAPEQKRHQQTFLASDVWSWARFVDELWPDGPPEEWRSVLTACRAADPLRRPRTTALLAHLQGEPSVLVDWLDLPITTEPASVTVELAGPDAPGTERVSELTPGTERVAEVTPGTERVPEVTGSGSLDTTPPSTRPTTALSPRSLPLASVPPTSTGPRRQPFPGCVQLLLIVTIILSVSCLGFATWWLVDRTSAAQERTIALERALKDYKTVKTLNNDTQREALQELAAHHFLQVEPARWRALAGLARAWSAGWQDADRKWAAADDAEAESLLALLDGNDHPEAALARGATHAALCRLKPTDLTSSGHCTEAAAEIDTFFETIEADPDQDPAGEEAAEDTRWLRVEAAWTAVLVDIRRSEAARAASQPDADVTLPLEHGLGRCDAGLAWLAWAPVNGTELLEDCLVLAGLSLTRTPPGGDAATALGRYHTYAERLLALDAPPIDRGTLRRLYTAAGPDCASVSVEKRRGDWSTKGDAWCLAVGHYARGCMDASRDVIAAHPGTETSHPWASLSAMVASSPSTCAR